MRTLQLEDSQFAKAYKHLVGFQGCDILEKPDRRVSSEPGVSMEEGVEGRAQCIFRAVDVFCRCRCGGCMSLHTCQAHGMPSAE